MRDQHEDIAIEGVLCLKYALFLKTTNCNWNSIDVFILSSIRSILPAYDNNFLFVIVLEKLSIKVF